MYQNFIDRENDLSDRMLHRGAYALGQREGCAEYVNQPRMYQVLPSEPIEDSISKIPALRTGILVYVISTSIILFIILILLLILIIKGR